MKQNKQKMMQKLKTNFIQFGIVTVKTKVYDIHDNEIIVNAFKIDYLVLNPYDDKKEVNNAYEIFFSS